MTILESTGIAEREYCASFLVFSSTNTIRRRIQNSGEYKSLLMALRDPNGPAQLVQELREALFTQRAPGFQHPMDITVLASVMALHERGFYEPKQWEALTAPYRVELFHGRYQPELPVIIL